MKNLRGVKTLTAVSIDPPLGDISSPLGGKVMCSHNLTINSSQDYAPGGIWQRILWAPLAFALIVQSGLPREVASNFGPSKP